MYVATLDGQYDIKAVKTVKIPAIVVYEELNNFKSWEKWNPMLTENLVNYSDENSGVGAELFVKFNDEDYSVKTLEVIPNQKIVQQVSLGSKISAEGYWVLKETEHGTEIVWGMHGENSFQQKIYWLLNGSIEQNMLPNYTKGLAQLEKYLTEKMEEHSFEIKGLVDYGGGFYLYKTTSCRIDKLQETIPIYFNEVAAYMKKNNVESFGHPFVIYHKLDAINKTALISACYPITERIITEGDVLTGFMDPIKTFKTVVKGDHKYIREGWAFSNKTLQEKGFIPVENGEAFEVYKLSKNNTLNPALWITEIYIPIQPIQPVQPVQPVQIN